MSDTIILTGDFLHVTMPMMGATVIPLVDPIPLTGTGLPASGTTRAVCLVGDEMPPIIQEPLPYVSPPYVMPGTGTLNIVLSPANMTKNTKNNGKFILLKGTTFQAIFQVMSPAMLQPAGPMPLVPDPLTTKVGTAQFVSTNMDLKAT